MQKQRSSSKPNNNHSSKKISKNNNKTHLQIELSKTEQVSYKHKNEFHKPLISPQNKILNKNKANSIQKQQKKKQHTLKVALQLAQFHKNQCEKWKVKSEQLQRKIQEINEELCGLVRQNAEIIQKQKKYQEKYKKIKQKYKQIKKSPFCQNKQIQNTPQFHSQHQSLNQSHINNQPFLLSYTTEKLQKLTKQISNKNYIIFQLQQKIQQCEHMTQNIYHLMDILEQKIQQLTKQNIILRNISNMVSKQKSRKNSQSIIQNIPENNQQTQLSYSQIVRIKAQQNCSKLSQNNIFSKLSTNFDMNNKENENITNIYLKNNMTDSQKYRSLKNSILQMKDDSGQNLYQNDNKNTKQARKTDNYYQTKNRISGILTNIPENANEHYFRYRQMQKHQNCQQFF